MSKDYQPKLLPFEIVHVSVWEWSSWHVAMSAHSNALNDRFDEFGADVGLRAYEASYPDRAIDEVAAARLKADVLAPFYDAFVIVAGSGAFSGTAFQAVEFWDTDERLLHRLPLT